MCGQTSQPLRIGPRKPPEKARALADDHVPIVKLKSPDENFTF